MSESSFQESFKRTNKIRVSYKLLRFTMLNKYLCKHCYSSSRVSIVIAHSIDPIHRFYLLPRAVLNWQYKKLRWSTCKRLLVASNWAQNKWQFTLIKIFSRKWGAGDMTALATLWQPEHPDVLCILWKACVNVCPMEEWEGGSQMGGCWDTENESLNNWEM